MYSWTYVLRCYIWVSNVCLFKKMTFQTCILITIFIVIFRLSKALKYCLLGISHIARFVYLFLSFYNEIITIAREQVSKPSFDSLSLSPSPRCVCACAYVALKARRCVYEGSVVSERLSPLCFILPFADCSRRQSPFAWHFLKSAELPASQ